MTFRAPRPPGFYGKVPARADFVGEGLDPATVECWDGWLQQALASSEARLGRAWRDAFFAAPIWRFVLPGGACGESGLMGVVMPSVDAVGRCFPLTLAREIEAGTDIIAAMAGGTRWFTAAEEAALSVLGEGLDLSPLSRELPGWKPPDQRASRKALRLDPRHRGIGAWMALPVASAGAVTKAVETLASRWGETSSASHKPGSGRWGRTLTEAGIWWTTGARATEAGSRVGLAPGLAITRGLVPPEGFAALLDGCWSRHGWIVPDDDASIGGAGGELKPVIRDWDWERTP